MEKIKLPIKFEAKKPEDIKFIPLEASKEMNGRQILSQHPTGREYGFLLENYGLYPVFTDANNEVLSMPPIINSHKTGKISNETKEVFIECSGFDFNILKKILNIVAYSLAEMGGKIYSMNLKYGNKTVWVYTGAKGYWIKNPDRKWWQIWKPRIIYVESTNTT